MYRLRASRPDTQPRPTTTPPASARQTSGGRGGRYERGHRKTLNGRWAPPPPPPPPPPGSPPTTQCDDRDHKSSRGRVPTRTTTMTPTMCHKSSRSNQASSLITIGPHCRVPPPPPSSSSKSCLPSRAHHHHHLLQRHSLHLFIILAFLLSSVPISGSSITERRGPEFLVEPQSSVAFLNDSGSAITCSAKGMPAPTITWTRNDGTVLTPVAGLRQIRKDLLTSQLVYLPFGAGDYRQDLHSAIVRCVASNAVGAIQSQNVHIRASVRQPYEIQVFDDFAIKGNTGILRCHVPSFVREYVKVTNWIGPDNQVIQSNLLKGGRYSVLANGELHVHRINDQNTPMAQSQSSSAAGSASGQQRAAAAAARQTYRCQTKHTLSGETKLSANSARLIVTEPQSRMPPKIISNVRHLVVMAGETIELPCSTQAYPWPSFNWYRASSLSSSISVSSLVDQHSSSLESIPSTFVSASGKQLNQLLVTHFKINSDGDSATSNSDVGQGSNSDELDEASDQESSLHHHHMYRYYPTATAHRVAKAGRLVQVDSSLFLKDITPSDSGLYTCLANNSVGQDRIEIELIVRAPLSAKLTPSHILATDGETITFNCSITGWPIGRIQWRRNARPLSASPSLASTSRVQLFDGDTKLQIQQVRREDKGMFQCLVNNDYESVQASAELALADDPPAFFYVFSVPEPLKPGGPLSIKCSATGVPLPQVVWTLDGAPLADHGRIRVGDYVSSDGVVHSFVNVTSLRPEDGGIYSCTASNDVHSISHSGRINVYGPAFVRPMKNITAISGHSVHLHCPAAGYPLESIVWYKKSGQGGLGVRLPENHRQKSLLNGTLLIEKVDRSNDQDVYRCVVTGASGTSKASAELFMRVLIAPSITFQEPEKNVREGTRPKFHCTVSEGDPPILIQFLKDGEALPDRVKVEFKVDEYATLSFASVVAEDSGNYTCIASNMAAVTTKSIVMKVDVLPKWRIAPSDVEAVQGQNVIIDCSASGEPRIWWERAFNKVPHSSSSSGSKSVNNGSPNPNAGQQSLMSLMAAGAVSGGHQTHHFRTVVSNSHMHTLENGSLMIRDISEEDSGVYLCQANNGVGSGLSKVIQVKVHVPAHFKSKFSAQTAQKGEAIEFVCDSFGEMPVHIGLAKDRMLLDFENNGPVHGELTLRTDNRYRVVRKTRDDGLSILVRIVNVDRRDSALFTCIANNAFGKDEYNFQLIVQEPPNKPDNVHVIEIESRSAVISWSAPYSGNSPIVSYHVEFRQTNNDVLSALPDWDEMSTKITSAAGHQPSSASASSSNNKGMVVLDIGSSPGGTVFRETIPGTETSFTLRGLKPMTNYEVRMQAENKLGLSGFTSILKIITKEESPSGPPQNIHVYPVSARGLQVTFQPPHNEHQNGQILGYYVGYKALDLDEHFMFKKVAEEKLVSGNSREVKISDLRRATKYVIIVQAFNRIGPGPQSEEVIGETLVNDPPKAPLLTSVNVDYDSIDLSWSVETSDDAQPVLKSSGAGSSGSGDPERRATSLLAQDTPEILGYYLYTKGPPYTEWEERQLDVSQNSYTLSKLQCGTQYQFYVIAYNNVGKGDPSQAIAVRTKGAAPIAPKHWSSFMSTNSTVAVVRLDAWMLNGCEIKYFILKYRTRLDSDWLVVSPQIYPAQRLVELIDLKPATWYVLHVAAHSEAGTTEETYMFATLTPNGETLPPLDTISKTLTSATSSTSSMAGGGFNSIQSLTILIPATCSVIVLTVIIIVACFVLGNKRNSPFDNTILTAIGGGGGSNGFRQGSLQPNGTLCMGGNGTPHHGTPGGLGGTSCDSSSEPRYGTTTTATYDHYGFNGLPSTNVDTFHMTIIGGGDLRKDVNAAGNIELTNCLNGLYATAVGKKRQLALNNANGNNNINNNCNNNNTCDNNNGGMNTNSITTCLDSKLMLAGDVKQQQQQQQLYGVNGNGTEMHNGNGDSGNETVHYFQTPYALSRLPRPPQQQQQSMDDGLIEGLPPPPPTSCCNNQAPQLGPTSTMPRPGRMNGDHVYDMPFPPKWV